MASKTELAKECAEATRARKAVESDATGSGDVVKALAAALKVEAAAFDKLSRYVTAETRRAPYERA